MAEKKKILYIVEAMGGGVFTYIVDFGCREAVSIGEEDMQRRQAASHF